MSLAVPSSLPREKCMPSNTVFWVLYKHTYMIPNSRWKPLTISINESQFELWGKRHELFWWFILPAQRKTYGKTAVHMLYNHITNYKTELSAGVHSTSFGLAPKSRLCSSSSLQSSSQERKAQELQNWIRHPPLILKIQSCFYDTSGENYLTKFDPESAMFTTFSVQKSFGAFFTSNGVQIN